MKEIESMNMLKPLPIISTLLLIVSCASTGYLGTEQPRLAADACGINTKTCFISDTGLSMDGTDTSINGYYSLDNTGGGTYAFSGSVKIEIDDLIITNIEFLRLSFIFFKGDLVVHDEIIQLTGRDKMGKNLEFSQIIKSDVDFDSSTWVRYNWSASE